MLRPLNLRQGMLTSHCLLILMIQVVIDVTTHQDGTAFSYTLQIVLGVEVKDVRCHFLEFRTLEDTVLLDQIFVEDAADSCYELC